MDINVCVRAERTIDRTTAFSPFLVPERVSENTEKNRLSLIGSSSPPSRSLFSWTDTRSPNLLPPPSFGRPSPSSFPLPPLRERERGGDAIDPPFPHCQIFRLPLGCVGHRRLSFFVDSAKYDSRSRPIRKQDNFFLFPSAAVEVLGSVWFLASAAVGVRRSFHSLPFS